MHVVEKKMAKKCVCFQTVAWENCKGENIPLLRAIFFHFYIQLKAVFPIIFHPISCQKKESTFKNINSALLKVCLHAPYSETIQDACQRFSNLGHQSHFSVLLFQKKKVYLCVCGCVHACVVPCY